MAPPIPKNGSSYYGDDEIATVAVPVDTVAGDLLLAFVAEADTRAGNHSGPPGWTKEVEIGAAVALSVIYSKIATGSEPVSYDFTTNDNRDKTIVILSFDGATIDPDNPIVATQTHFSGSTQNFTFTGPIGGSPGDLTFYVWSKRNNDGLSEVEETALTQQILSNRPDANHQAFFVQSEIASGQSQARPRILQSASSSTQERYTVGASVLLRNGKLQEYYVKDGGVWKPVDTLSVRDGGVWKEAEYHVRDGGVWKKVYG